MAIRCPSSHLFHAAFAVSDLVMLEAIVAARGVKRIPIHAYAFE
jgi:hypothetical protein